LADFDGVTYKIAITNKTDLTFSMSLVCFKQLLEYGAQSVLQREYGAYYQLTPEPGFDVTLSINLQSLPSDIGI
jgi:actin related protein 2/3 complex subunit 2